MVRIITAGFIVLATIPAYGQGMPGGNGQGMPGASGQEMSGGKRHHGQEQKAEDQKKKPDDKGYNSSLAKMPDRKYDPWQNIR